MQEPFLEAQIALSDTCTFPSPSPRGRGTQQPMGQTFHLELSHFLLETAWLSLGQILSATGKRIPSPSGSFRESFDLEVSSSALSQVASSSVFTDWRFLGKKILSCCNTVEHPGFSGTLPFCTLLKTWPVWILNQIKGEKKNKSPVKYLSVFLPFSNLMHPRGKTFKYRITARC